VPFAAPKFLPADLGVLNQKIERHLQRIGDEAKRHPAERLVTVVKAPTTSNSPARLTS
jgi:hypothetical protein